jgi:hypothetical protein
MAAADAPSVRVPFPLQQDERVIALIRRHWWFLWPHTAVLALIALVPPIVAGVLMARTDTYDGVAATIFWIASAVWLLYWGVRLYLNWYRYHHDIWVITNQRIVDSLKRHPLSHRMSTADLVNVQDMSIERHGLLPTLLNFGDIVCETASEGGEFVLSGIPRPQEVQLVVDRERDRERRGISPR